MDSPLNGLSQEEQLERERKQFAKMHRPGSGSRRLADAYRFSPPELGDETGAYDPMIEPQQGK